MEGFEKSGSRTTKIEAETAAVIFTAKCGAVVECQMGSVDKTVADVVVVKSQIGEVEPSQI